MTKEQYLEIDSKLESMIEQIEALEEMTPSRMARMRVQAWRQNEPHLTDEELAQRLVDEPDLGYDLSLAYDEIEELGDEESASDDDASGDIEAEFERKFDYYEMEGFPDALERTFDDLQRKHGFTRHELEMMLDL